MDQEQSDILISVRQALLCLLSGKPADPLVEYENLKESELQKLCETTNLLIRQYAEAYDFLSSLAKGDLETEPPHRNFLISPFKTLHSNLRHLTWQTKRVAEGDYSQRVDFLGEFSDAFNTMIESFRQKSTIEFALKRSEERLALAIDGASLGLWDCHIGSGQSFFNRRWAEMLEYDFAEIEQRINFWHELIHPEDKTDFLAAWEAHLNHNTPIFRAEHRLSAKSGNWRWILCIGKTVDTDNHGKASRVAGIFVDITEQKNADEEKQHLLNQLAQAQKMEAIGTLTGGIAHDFNNLLTIINGYTEWVLLQMGEDDPSYSDLQSILDAVRKGADLVQRLLAFSKKADISLNPLDLNLTVDNTVKLLQRTIPKVIEIETSLATDLGMVNADVVKIGQVLMNMCINAGEAMPEGGNIRIATRNVVVDEVYCKTHLEAKVGPHVLIEVTDTGRGMDSTTADRIFDPFFTTKKLDYKKGTGLGLSVAKGIVEQHGGWITCESQLGKGATFSVYFPAIEEESWSRKPAPLRAMTPGEAKILLVDDEEHVRDLAKRFLERAGYRVITAADGIKALEVYEREQSDIELVILDLIMPKMDGEKCLEKFLKMNPKLKVIVSSGHSLTAQERIRLGVHAKGFANKPYKHEQFLAIVKKVLAL